MHFEQTVETAQGCCIVNPHGTKIASAEFDCAATSKRMFSRGLSLRLEPLPMQYVYDIYFGPAGGIHFSLSGHAVGARCRILLIPLGFPCLIELPLCALLDCFLAHFLQAYVICQVVEAFDTKSFRRTAMTQGLRTTCSVFP